MENFDFYISSMGYLVIPIDSTISKKYLINFEESSIPSMPEATEASVRIAGRDGDIPLNTVYEPIPFEIVCYTDDNLTPEQKVEEENFLNNFLNSIKTTTKTFAMQRKSKFYDVKYNGALTTKEYPKHLQFTIPLKSSESYAKALTESEIIGNGSKSSSTIKETGAIFTIEGPALKPIITFNNYEMKYNENILEGNKIIIDSGNSTITHITSAGVKTNAMLVYNHQFPKVKNGTNTLSVSSGITDATKVNVKWYDLKL